MLEKNFIKRDLTIIGVDCLAIGFSFLLSFALFEGVRPYANPFGGSAWIPLILVSLGYAALWIMSGGWSGSWRYTSLHDVMNVSKITFLCNACVYFLFFLHYKISFNSFFLLHWFLVVACLCMPRIAYRLYLERTTPVSHQKKRQKALLVYGGYETEIFLRYHRHHSETSYEIEGILDPSGRHVKQKILGVPVLGSLQDLPRVLDTLKKPNTECVLILPSEAIPDWPTRKVAEWAKTLGVWVGKVPMMSAVKSLEEGEKALALKGLSIEDLLGRPAHRLDHQDLEHLIRDHTILVTGAGGSIGSELVRQLARLNPHRLICFEHNEYALYQIDSELQSTHPSIIRKAIIGDIRDRACLDHVFKQEKPQVVFHAAALKHVPLVEENVPESILTNVVGTQNVADLCVAHGVRLMVQISTDKVVKPSSVMGATKRVAEMYTQTLDRSQDVTRFVTVRFGNVLGSHGSVVPLFQKQIAEGGPVTVTHPEMTRYFMSIQEAASLVIQALLLGSQTDWVPGQILVLDMGEPVRIVDLAHEMIRLSGARGVSITYTGIRPGEKMHEELFLPQETILPSRNSSIRSAASCPPDRDTILQACEQLFKAAHKRDQKRIIALLNNLIQDFQPMTPQHP